MLYLQRVVVAPGCFHPLCACQDVAPKVVALAGLSKMSPPIFQYFFVFLSSSTKLQHVKHGGAQVGSRVTPAESQEEGGGQMVPKMQHSDGQRTAFWGKYKTAI